MEPPVTFTLDELVPWIGVLVAFLVWAIVASIHLSRSLRNFDELCARDRQLRISMDRGVEALRRSEVECAAWHQVARDYQVKYRRACAVIRNMRRRMGTMIRAEDISRIRQAYELHTVEALTAAFWRAFRGEVRLIGRMPTRVRLTPGDAYIGDPVMRDRLILEALRGRLQAEMDKAGYVGVTVCVKPSHWLVPTSVKVLLQGPT